MTVPKQKPGRSRQDYETPDEFVRACEQRFGSFVCDLAAREDNAKTSKFYTPEQNTLVQPWAIDYPTGTLWLNPEFAHIDPYAEKCYLESKLRHGLILMLTPASIGTEWFARHVEAKAMIIGLRPRITFVGEVQSYPKDLSLIVFGYGFHGFQTWRWKE